MDLYLIFLIFLLNIIISSGQFPSIFPAPLQNYYPTEDLDYGMSFRSKYGVPYRNSGGMLPYIEDYDEQSYVDSEECKCSCRKCERPKPCCRQMCFMCNQPNFVLLPYPYPLVITTPPTTKETTTISTTLATPTATTSLTTTSSATTEAKRVQSKGDLDVGDFPVKTPQLNGDGKFMLASLRRTKSDWRPKYGIVPIPDQLADILMTQLRNMKEINSR